MRTALLLLATGMLHLGAQAALKDILEIDKTKANTMADLKFDTKGFAARDFQGLKEFRTDQINPGKEFKTDRRYNPGGREFPTTQAEIFTGESVLKGETSMFSRTSSLQGRKPELNDRTPFTQADNPMGDKRFNAADRRYEGPELKRRTREIDIINSTLRAKEGAEGRVLSMDEVRDILNKNQ
jgi:hypothetical protein